MFFNMPIYSSCRKFLRIIRTQAYTLFIIISGPVNPPVVDSVYNNKKKNYDYER